MCLKHDDPTFRFMVQSCFLVLQDVPCLCHLSQLLSLCCPFPYVPSRPSVLRFFKFSTFKIELIIVLPLYLFNPKVRETMLLFLLLHYFLGQCHHSPMLSKTGTLFLVLCPSSFLHSLNQSPSPIDSTHDSPCPNHPLPCLYYYYDSSGSYHLSLGQLQELPDVSNLSLFQSTTPQLHPPYTHCCPGLDCKARLESIPISFTNLSTQPLP